MSPKLAFQECIEEYRWSDTLYYILTCAFRSAIEHEANMYVYYDRESRQYRFTKFGNNPDVVYCVTPDGFILN